MQRDEIFSNLKSLVAERFEVSPDTLSLETTQSDLQIDSILMVDLMMDVEERLSFTFDSLDLPNQRCAMVAATILLFLCLQTMEGKATAAGSLCAQRKFWKYLRRHFSESFRAAAWPFYSGL